MIRSLIPIWIALSVAYTSDAQQYIGKHKDEVIQIMNSERKDLHIDESSRNTVYNLLKYIDRNNTQTIYYVFDDKDTCRFYKTIYDYVYLRQVERDLNRNYDRASSLSWYFMENNEKYLVTLKKDKWYFSVLVKKATV